MVLRVPDNKRIEIALRSIHGIGPVAAVKITARAGLLGNPRVRDVSDEDLTKIREIVDQEYMVEGDLRREVSLNIKRLVDLGNYRGLRHRKGLPVNGQRTKTNARTRKGPRKTVANKKKVTK